MATIIAIANQKGGVGKTTTTTELCYLFGKDNRVLGIDLDGQPNLSRFLGADLEKPSIYNLLNGECDLEDAIQRVANFDFIASHPKLSFAQKLFVEGDDQFLLQDILSYTKGYDYIFLDCPPQRGILQEMALVASDYCIGVTKVDDGGLIGLLELNADIELKKKRGSSKIKMLGLLFNDFQNTTADADSISELENLAKKMGTTTFETIVRHSIKASTCKKKKCSVTELDSNNNVAKDYLSLKSEIELRIKELQK